jgi:hypothetical protein
VSRRAGFTCFSPLQHRLVTSADHPQHVKTASPGAPAVLVPGDLVRSSRDIPGLLRTVVPRGTDGIVLELRQYGTVIVRFDNGRTLGICDADLDPATS